MKLEYFGHSCFRISHEGYRIVVDPYDCTMFEGVGPLKLDAHRVVCSHGHGDHNYVEAVTLEEGKESTITVSTLECFHDEVQGAKRGKNIIHVFKTDHETIVHLGDLGHELSDEVVSALGKVDVLLLPIGGFYTINPEVALKVATKIDPATIVPMHYRLQGVGIKGIAELRDFLSLVDTYKEVETPIWDCSDITTEVTILPPLWHSV